jgi:hypothetical protein
VQFVVFHIHYCIMILYFLSRKFSIQFLDTEPSNKWLKLPPIYGLMCLWRLSWRKEQKLLSLLLQGRNSSTKSLTVWAWLRWSFHVSMFTFCIVICSISICWWDTVQNVDASFLRLKVKGISQATLWSGASLWIQFLRRPICE